MLDLMTWNEILDDLLAAGTLQRAAIFDLTGERLAASEDVVMTASDALSIMKSMTAIRITKNTIFGLYLENAKYSCFPVDSDTLIGRHETAIFVAHRNQKVLICGFATEDSNGSCLCQVRGFADKLAQGIPTGPNSTPSLI